MKSIFKSAGIVLVLVALMFIFVSGCSKPPTESTTAGTGDTEVKEISVLVPCGIQGPFYEIKALFEEANPNVKVKESAENIAVLTRKIMEGIESPEVFMSLGDKELERIEAKGRVVPGTVTPYAENCLALIGPREGAVITTLADVAKPEVKNFIMPDPDKSTAGFHAREAMEKLGIWEDVKKKTRIPEQPEEVAQSVAKGESQAGIAYWPCIYETHDPNEVNPKPRKKIIPVEVIPQDLYTPFKCNAAVIEGAQYPELGKEFIAFLNGPEAQELFKKWFFMNPDEASEVQKGG